MATNEVATAAVAGVQPIQSSQQLCRSFTLLTGPKTASHYVGK